MCWRADARDPEGARAVRLAMVEEIRTLADSAADLFAIELLIGELISNVARYTPGPFCSELTWKSDGAAQIVFHDAGDCFLTVDRQMPEPDDGLERGRGIALLRTLGGKLHVEPHDSDAGGCLVQITLPARLRADRIAGESYCPEGRAKTRGGLCTRPGRFARSNREQGFNQM